MAIKSEDYDSFLRDDRGDTPSNHHIVIVWDDHVISQFCSKYFEWVGWFQDGQFRRTLGDKNSGEVESVAFTSREDSNSVMLCVRQKQLSLSICNLDLREGFWSRLNPLLSQNATSAAIVPAGMDGDFAVISSLGLHLLNYFRSPHSGAVLLQPSSE